MTRWLAEFRTLLVIRYIQIDALPIHLLLIYLSPLYRYRQHDMADAITSANSEMPPIIPRNETDSCICE